jgi:hypothetical protein
VALLSLPEAVRDYPAVHVDAEGAAMVAHGRVLPNFEGHATDPSSDRGPWAVLGPDGSLLAMYERAGATTVKPAVVVASQS